MKQESIQLMMQEKGVRKMPKVLNPETGEMEEFGSIVLVWDRLTQPLLSFQKLNNSNSRLTSIGVSLFISNNNML